jgi:hypothetical protein
MRLRILLSALTVALILTVLYAGRRKAVLPAAGSVPPAPAFAPARPPAQPCGENNLQEKPKQLLSLDQDPACGEGGTPGGLKPDLR